MANINDLIWVEKYRPRTLQDIMLPQRIKDKFKDGCYGNFLFVGIQGCGKTTLARILAGNYDTLIINASIDNGVDVIREKIIKFCANASFKGYRYVILDEADMLSQAAQAGLRGTIEMFNKVARFIFTCNYPEKILDPIKSRLEIIDMNFTEEEEREQYINHLKRVVQICKKEGLKITQAPAEMLVKKHFPDLRTVINTLQSLSKTTDEITVDSISKESLNSADKELYEFLMKASYPPDIYAYIKSNYVNKERECYQKLSSEFIDWLIANDKGGYITQIAVIVHKYQYESERSIDKLISLLACCAEISRVFK